MTKVDINGTLLSSNVNMHLAELIVIYLAYGAPFGLYDVIFFRKTLSIADARIVAAKFLFWPVVLVSWIYKWSPYGRTYSEVDLENQVHAIGNLLEALAFSDRSAVTIFPFRELFARYTCLTLMLMRNASSLDYHPLEELLAGEPSAASVACLNRLDRYRMAFHQSLARKEFLDIIRRLSSSSPARDDLILNSIELATALNDHDCTQGLYAMLPNDKGRGMCSPLSVPKPAN